MSNASTIYILSVGLLGSYTFSVRAICFGRHVCRLSVPHQISKTKQDRHEMSPLLWETGSPSKNMTSEFAPEVAKYPQSSPKPKNSLNSVWASSLSPLAIQLVSSYSGTYLDAVSISFTAEPETWFCVEWLQCCLLCSLKYRRRRWRRPQTSTCLISCASVKRSCWNSWKNWRCLASTSSSSHCRWMQKKLVKLRIYLARPTYLPAEWAL